MPNFNRVILAGHMTRDPQLKYLPNNTAVCEFGMAINRQWRDKDGNKKEDVCFVDVSAFGPTGEAINKYMKKGRAILVEGRLKYDQWTAQDGGKRNKLTVIADAAQFLGDPKGGTHDRSVPEAEPQLPDGAGVPNEQLDGGIPF